MNRLLEVNNLQVNFKAHGGTVHAVRDVSFHLNQGEVVGLVGESGCGKSVTAQMIMRLIPSPPVEIVSGEIWFEGEELLSKEEVEMRQIRGKKIGMVFQDPLTSLDPTMTIGKQIIEGIFQHERISKKEAWNQAIELLHLVGIAEPEKRVNQYPFEFSGGMRQRVVIAMAIACNPQLLIADEPTTALDVTIQAQILSLLKNLQDKKKMSILLITHDLGIVAGMCDRVMVMYAGKIVEVGTVEQIFYQPQHPYTKALLKAIPRLDLGKEKPLQSIFGSPPDLSHPPAGCSFHPRCPSAMPVCCSYEPLLEDLEGEHRSACWLLQKERLSHGK